VTALYWHVIVCFYMKLFLLLQLITERVAMSLSRPTLSVCVCVCDVLLRLHCRWSWSDTRRRNYYQRWIKASFFCQKTCPSLSFLLSSGDSLTRMHRHTTVSAVRDVSEFKSQRCPILAVVCKSEIRRIFRLIYIGFGFNCRFGKPSFTFHCSLPLPMQK